MEGGINGNGAAVSDDGLRAPTTMSSRKPLAATAVTYGLSTEEAIDIIVKDIRETCDLYKREAVDVHCCPLLWSVPGFLQTTDGVMVIACSVACATGELLLSRLFRRVAWTWQVIVSLSIILTYVWVNIVISYKLRKAELIRPFVQVEEALCSTLHRSTPSSATTHEPFWPPPGSSLIATLRDGRWKLVPRNTIVRGDLYKLRVGKRFPAASVRVSLSVESRPCKRRATAAPPCLATIQEQRWLGSESQETQTPPSRKGISIAAAARKEQRKQETIRRFAAEISRASASYSKVNLTLDQGPHTPTLYQQNQLLTLDILHTAPGRYSPEQQDRVRSSTTATTDTIPARTTNISPRMANRLSRIPGPLRAMLSPTSLGIRHTPHSSPALQSVGSEVVDVAAETFPGAAVYPHVSPRLQQAPPAAPSVPTAATSAGSPQAAAPAAAGVPAGCPSAEPSSESYLPGGAGCGDEVGFMTFLAVSTACIPSVEKFLSRSVPHKMTDPWKNSKRTKTTFFEVAAVLRRFLSFVFLGGLALLVLALSMWTLAWNRADCPHCDNADALRYWRSSLCLLWLNLAYFAAAFMPMVYRVMVEVTDLWGNARLQSLFQWLQDTRFPAILSGSQQRAGRVAEAFSSSSSSSSTSTSQTDSVVASSVDSRMSVSHLPFKNQLTELLAVLTQGLDGANNLLHTLNSTTSVVFVDKEGVLTESQRTVQEICVAESLRATRRHGSGTAGGASAAEVATQVVSPIKSSGASSSVASEARTLTKKELSLKTDRLDVDDSPSPPAKPSALKRRPSTSPAGREELRDADGRLYQPSEQGLISYAPAGSSAFVAGKTVLDLLQSQDDPEGLRFYKDALSKRCLSTLRPLATMLAAAKMPVNEALHQDFSHAMWSFGTTMRDLLQTKGLVADTAMECLCCLKTLCGVHAGVAESLSLARFILLFNSVRGLDTTAWPVTADHRYVAALWLFRARDGSMQLLSKGKPSAILSRSEYYFDGDRIRPMSAEFRRSLYELVAQWKGNGLDCIAIGYRPVDQHLQTLALNLLDDHSAFFLPRRGDCSATGSPTQRSLTLTPQNGCSESGGMADQSPTAWRRLDIFPGARSSIAAGPVVAVVALRRTRNCATERIDFRDYSGRVRPVEWMHLAESPVRTCEKCADPARPPSPLPAVGERVAQCDAVASPLLLCAALPLSEAPPTQCPLLRQGLHFHLLLNHQAVLCAGPARSEELVRALAGQQVLLGMAALKLSTPQELQQRVASFHEAGIRFVHASREDAKRTKAVGRLLGLDTDWNACVSLRPSPEGVRNIVGNIVIPSGIDDIRRHIREVDNVPLQVSLFSDGDAQSILDLIKVLQENGEVVTCVGGARRCSNFDVFSQANCSMSVTVDSPPVCRSCSGRRCIGRMNCHSVPMLSVEFELSAALTSLPCSLQIHMQSADVCKGNNWSAAASAEDPRWLAELLYEAFKESRRIVEAVLQTLSFFAGVTVGFIGPMLFFAGILHLPPAFNMLSLTIVSLVVLPVICASLLYAPASESIMHEYPRRLAEPGNNSMVSVKHICIHHALRFVLSSCACLLLSNMYFTRALKSKLQALVAAVKASPTSGVPGSLAVAAEVCADKVRLLSTFAGGWVECHTVYMAAVQGVAAEGWQKHSAFTDPLVENMLATQLVVLLFIAIMSLSYIDRFRGFREVPPWRHAWLLLTLAIVCPLFALFHLMVNFLQTGFVKIQSPPWNFWVLLVLWLACIVIIDDVTKRSARRRFEIQQKYLKLVFATRLGMWSPK